MTDATYLDCSGSVMAFDPDGTVLAQHATSGPRFYFSGRVHDERPLYGQSTDFGAVFRHARTKGFQCIRIVTDGFADGYKSQPYGLNVEWVQVTR